MIEDPTRDTQGGPSEHDGSESRAITLLTLVNVVLRQRRLVIATAAIALSFAVVKGILTKTHYSASASFTPTMASTPSGLSGIAAQFGMDVGNEGGSQSPAFYVDLLESRPLLQGIVRERYATSDGDSSNLLEVFGISGPTEAVRVERAVRALRASTRVAMSQRTGVVSFTITARDPLLPPQIARRMLEAVNRFNVDGRRTQASMERQFTEERVRQIREELQAAEARHLAFSQANRSVANDPALRLQESRLSREVERLQTIYASLTQAYERARIDEVRDTPSISVIEHPENAVLPVARGRVRKAVVALTLGLVLGIVLAFTREIIVNNRASSRLDSEEFARLKSEVVAGVVTAMRLGRQSKGRPVR